jgi:hypothetical protein
MQPVDREAVALRRNLCPAGAANRIQRIIVNLTPRHHRDPFVEQIDKRAQNAALGLAAKTEQNEIVARQYGVDELRNDGFVVTDDAGK